MAKTTTKVAVGGGGLAAAIALITPFIQQHEGYVARPYKDIGGVISVCNGHTGPDIVVKTYSRADCQALTDKDIAKSAQWVLKITPDLDRRPYVLASAISFTYNLGDGAYQKSSVARDFNKGTQLSYFGPFYLVSEASNAYFKLGCADMLKYVYVGKTYTQGLANRRNAEYQVCMKGTS